MLSKLSILVADDSEIDRRLMQAQLQEMGCRQVILAESGQDAVEKYQLLRPHLVLMDLRMPHLNGLEACQKIKKLSPRLWIPVIFLTAEDRYEELIRCLQEGDDFLVKPIHFAILKAKLGVMQRGLELQEQILEKSMELERYHSHAEEEKRFTAHLVRNMIEGPALRDPVLQSGIFPAEHHSGDLIIAARSPRQSLFVMLADGTGHGLAAAINVLPLPQIFYAMVAKGFGISSLVKELNEKAYGWLPRDRFVAVTVVEVSERERIIRIWNGGNPRLLLMSPQGQVLQEWSSKNLPLGILRDHEFDSSYETYRIQSPGQLALVSDGLLEAENSLGNAYGWERFTQALGKSPPAERLQSVVDDLLAYLGGGQAHDDVSLLLVDVGVDCEMPVQAQLEQRDKNHAAGEEDPWRMEISLGASELRYYDLTPELLTILDKLRGIRTHKTFLFLIVSELLNNAIDHGLLRLDSAIKLEPEGFDRYMQLREERMAELDQGVITVSLERVRREGRRMLRISVRDSGNGFNPEQQAEALGPQSLPNRRGLNLVKNLSVEMEFLHHGAEVVAYFAY